MASLVVSIMRSRLQHILLDEAEKQGGELEFGEGLKPMEERWQH